MPVGSTCRAPAFSVTLPSRHAHRSMAALPGVAKWGAGMVSPTLGDRAFIFKIMVFLLIFDYRL